LSGLRAFIAEVDTTEQQEPIAGKLASRGLLVSRRDQNEWTAIEGRDPDAVAIVVASAPGEGRISETSWRTLDDLLYGIGESRRSWDNWSLPTPGWLGMETLPP
jgi:hypothetical protein